ncbi:MAG: hypothetical protein IJQ84_04395 [Paludibacteraceae bacterium]|nr:hypothetical protein [Paludibacteraceae bacterium]
MKRSTQTLLYHLLPIVFWLLAIGGIVLWEILSTFNLQLSTYIPAVLVLLSMLIIRHIPRHTDSTTQCFQVALLLGLASYWAPSVLFLMIPIWGYLIYQRLFSLRAFSASLIGFACMAVWIVVLNQLHITHYTLHIVNNLFAWIPTGSVLFAYIASTIARQILRVR